MKRVQQHGSEEVRAAENGEVEERPGEGQVTLLVTIQVAKGSKTTPMVSTVRSKRDEASVADRRRQARNLDEGGTKIPQATLVKMEGHRVSGGEELRNSVNGAVGSTSTWRARATQ